MKVKPTSFLWIIMAAWLPIHAQQTGKWGDQGDGTFRNPVIAADYSDPDPLRVGEDYYLVASTFESYPGVTILHSKDLVNWTTIGAALTDLTGVDSAYSAKRMDRYRSRHTEYGRKDGLSVAQAHCWFPGINSTVGR